MIPYMDNKKEKTMTDKKMGNVIGAMELEVNNMFMTPESTQDLFGHPMFKGNPDCVVAAMMTWNLIASKQKSVLSGDDLTKLIHHTVKAWADEEAELNDDGDPILSPHRYFEMMKQLSDECYLNRHNYSLDYKEKKCDLVR